MEFLKALTKVFITGMLEMMSKLDSIRQYLESFLELDRRVNKGQGGGIIDYYKLLLDQGTVFTDRKLVKDYSEASQWAKHFRPKSKECFYNSQMFVLECDKYQYFEGFALASILPFHHAWVVIDNTVLDFTLEAAAKKLGNFYYNNMVYLGVEVPNPVIRDLVLKYESAEPWAHMHYLGAKEHFF